MLRKLSLFYFLPSRIGSSNSLEVIITVEDLLLREAECCWKSVVSYFTKICHSRLFKVYLLGQLTESSDGLIFRQQPLVWFASGTTTVTVSDVSPINAKDFEKTNISQYPYKRAKFLREIILSVLMYRWKTVQCWALIAFTYANQVSGITFSSPENNANVNEKSGIFHWAPLPGTGNQYKLYLPKKTEHTQQSLPDSGIWKNTQNATFLVYPVSASQRRENLALPLIIRATYLHLQKVK